MIRKCDGCNELTENKYLGKINGFRLCKKCRVKLRQNHREETIETAGIRDDLRLLKNKFQREKGYGRKEYKEKKVGYKVGEYKKDKTFQPQIKGSTFAKTREKSNAYIEFKEKQTLLKMLMNSGMDFKEAT
jgi:hypothetical protein